MNVTLDKEDLISLVKGKDPHYDVMSHPLVKANGHYSGGMNDHWSWNYSLAHLTEAQLWEIYTVCKESWG